MEHRESHLNEFIQNYVIIYFNLLNNYSQHQKLITSPKYKDKI